MKRASSLEDCRESSLNIFDIDEEIQKSNYSQSPNHFDERGNNNHSDMLVEDEIANKINKRGVCTPLSPLAE